MNPFTSLKLGESTILQEFTFQFMPDSSRQTWTGKMTALIASSPPDEGNPIDVSILSLALLQPETHPPQAVFFATIDYEQDTEHELTEDGYFVLSKLLDDYSDDFDPGELNPYQQTIFKLKDEIEKWLKQEFQVLFTEMLNARYQSLNPEFCTKYTK